MTILATLLALAASASTAGPPKSFTMTMSVRPDSAEGQLLLAQEAQRRCGRRFAQAGRYQFEGKERLAPKPTKAAKWKARQEYACLVAPPSIAQVPASAIDPAWQPTPAVEQAVLDATNRYFALEDAGDGVGLHAMWSASNQQMMPLAKRQEHLATQRKEAGAPLDHRILKLTWYVNPPGVDVPGVYVAADYEKRHRNLAANCGYLVWLREASGALTIVREESGRVTKAQAARMSPGVLAEARAQMRCPPA